MILRRASLHAFLALAASLSLTVPALGGVHVALQGPAGAVTPNTEFDVDVVVTQAGSSFNGLDLIVTYDPAVLTLVPRSPLSLQEGTLMTAACGNRFHRFRQGADRDTITDVLLCAGASVAGPGQVYRLRFHASATPQVTSIQFAPASRFYQAGVEVTPVTYANATIGIGITLDVEAEPHGALQVRAVPNPFRSEAVLTLRVSEAGPHELVIRDLSGRTVQTLHRGWLEAGEHAFRWDGHTRDGRDARPGLYFLSAAGMRSSVRGPLTRIR